eukprot:TRINITY_DN486_c0_g1_i1.p1 TRINITY_DN486_c0_g1~~TRINITY_DN486_c0_g1_i1.p1  ORF type:complete len:927 (+),score=229.05 TRINITY_DN486_c0_g1_i1:57-2837(+)
MGALSGSNDPPIGSRMRGEARHTFAAADSEMHDGMPRHPPPHLSRQGQPGMMHGHGHGHAHGHGHGRCSMPMTRSNEQQVAAAEEELRRFFPLSNVFVRDPLDANSRTNTHTNSVVIYDPCNRLGYLVSINEVIFSTGKELLWKATFNGETQDNVYKSGDRKRFFLCMLFQDNRCKGYQRCNNIHLDRARVSQLRAQYQGRARSKAMQHDVTSLCVSVPDVEDPSRNIQIRVGSTLETQGRALGLRGGTVRLCQTNVSGSECSNGVMCRDIHLRDDVIRAFWVACCVTHNPPVQEDHVFVERVKSLRLSVKFRSELVPIDPAHLGITDGLKVLCREHPGVNKFEFPRGKFCHRHLNRECKYGYHCNNIHVCRAHFHQYFSQGVQGDFHACPQDPWQHQVCTMPAPAPPAAAGALQIVVAEAPQVQPGGQMLQTLDSGSPMHIVLQQQQPVLTTAGMHRMGGVGSSGLAAVPLLHQTAVPSPPLAGASAGPGGGGGGGGGGAGHERAEPIGTGRWCVFPLFGAIRGARLMGSAAVTRGGFLYSFGGAEHGEGTNMLHRALLGNTVDVDIHSIGEGLAKLLRRSQLRPQDWFADLHMTLNGRSVWAHRCIVAARAPAFFDAVISCSTAEVDRKEAYVLDGNRRRQGLPAVPDSDTLLSFLHFLYSGHLREKEDPATLAALQDVAVAFRSGDLTDALAALRPELPPAGRLRHGSPRRQHLADPDARLGAAFRPLLQGSIMIDMTLVPRETKEGIDAHRAILVAAAPSLRPSLSVPSKSRKISLESVSQHGLKLALEWVYTGHCGATVDNAVALLGAAQALHLVGLRSVCEELLWRELGDRPASLPDLLTIAAKYEAPQLREHTLARIATHGEAMRKIPGFDSLTPELVSEVDEMCREMGLRALPARALGTQQQPDAVYQKRAAGVFMGM